MHLQAGEWSLEFRDGDLRHVRLAGVDAVERVYFALRDGQWGTVPFQISGLKTEVSGGGFRVSFDAEHKQGAVHFRWRGEIEGTAEGVVRYKASGEALSSFKRNRIGLCVHHPLACAGRPVAVTHPDGTTSGATFTKLISPHQPALNIRAMAYDAGPGRVAEIRFSGDVYEMEDQRNWSDASFKTYPTPLALPYPVDVAAGTKVEQTVEIRLRYTGGRRALPVGLTLDGTAPEPAAVERLHRLRLAHMRVEEHGRLAEAARWSMPIELALTLGPEPEKDLAAIETGGVQLARVIVYRSDEPIVAAKWLALVRGRFPGVQVMAGSNQNFAELNRNRPADFSQGIAFGLHPQVHAVDEETIMANLASHDSLMESVQAFAKGAPVVLSPVTFGPRGQTDARLLTGFGAAWTRGALANFERLGVASATVLTVGAVLATPVLERLFGGGATE